MISLNLQNLIPPKEADPVFGKGTDAFFSLLNLISDPAAAKERLGQIFNAVMEANEVIRAAKATQDELAAARKAHDGQLIRERTEHDRALAEAKTKSNADCNQAMEDIRSKQERASKAVAKAEADATAAADLKADLEQRLAKIRLAAA
jgi:hypothetical protein